MIDFSKDVKIAIACPSYKRPFCRTAHYIKSTRVYVDASEYDEYVKANEGYGEIVKCEDGIQGNLPRVRNYILDTEFNKNHADIVVMMDDDVKAVGMHKPSEKNNFGYKKVVFDTEDKFKRFIIYGSIICQEWGLGMWGVNHNTDEMLYKHFEPFYTLRSSVGQFMVFVKNKLRFDENLPLKEDYDMNIQQCNKYRGCLMLSFAWVQGDFGKLGGGTAVRRNFDREYEQFKLFKKKWGSKIVYGVNMKANHSHENGERKQVINKYDFSHPKVKVPIKGI